ncbi:Hint domain-containing protein [Allitabrizicola rongguiensis]|uniref:Hint domain-containing protein n=1 Tax=Alitabrizicola rongguiensis TaxID=2909234 RepID=UPI0029E7F6B6|nr:Hint domain-containing protein [Tabrizicola rongguiensis]
MLVTGAAWRWTGTAVRVDGAGGLLTLDGAMGAAELRRRAARKVRRLVGAAFASGSSDDAGVDGDDAPTQDFVVTDGRQAYSVTLIDVPHQDSRLLMFFDEIPPADTDLWIVRASLDHVPQPVPNEGGVICFTQGTRLLTPEGLRRIEDLRPGDKVQTRDNGAQEILWTGNRRMSGARLHVMPHLRPIRIRSAAFGMGQPDADLIVSPHHRMLICGRAAESLFGTSEVLVAAEDLMNDLSVTVDRQLREVTYVHILLEHHQIVWANGIQAESFHPSNTSLEMIEPGQRKALFDVIPDLAIHRDAYGAFARRNVSASEAAILRHELAE